jgi:aerobic-type carbon monoxide dehydrogenase small subunit (CoxS/CutS family)
MSCAALLARTPDPTDDEITTAMNGNICRCGTYVRIKEAVKLAATMRSSR